MPPSPPSWSWRSPFADAAAAADLKPTGAPIPNGNIATPDWLHDPMPGLPA